MNNISLLINMYVNKTPIKRLRTLDHEAIALLKAPTEECHSDFRSLADLSSSSDESYHSSDDEY